MNKYISMVFILLIQTQAIWAGSTPVGTQFTYQGELIDGGSPANGEYDLQIQLYATETSGSPIDFNFIDDITITNGLINTTLDFGDLPFNGDESYLQINIRAGNSTGNFVTLSPRQRINVTPYAIQSAFVENGASLWAEVSGGINYGQQVFVGAPSSSNSLLTTNSSSNVSPFRARINGSTKFSVQDNGGASVGTGAVAPDNGLIVQGQAQQSLTSHGFVKAGVVIDCGAGINGGSQRFFNNVNDNDFTTTQNGAAGNCAITVPFDISDSFFTVSAYETGGVNVFQTMVASCSAINATQIQCQLHLVVGSNTSLSNGVLQLMVY